MTKKLILFLFALFFFFGIAKNVNAQTQKAPQTEKRVEAIITKVLEDSQIIEDSGNKHPYQRLQLLGTSGEYKGKSFVIENGKYDQTGIIDYKVGDKVVLSVIKDSQGKDSFSVTDFVRRTPLLFLFLIFVGLAVVVGGKRGMTSLIGMAITFAILLLFVLPQVLKGADPVSTTLIASIVIVPVTFCLSHGVNKKSLSAIIGTFISLLITGLLAYFFVESSHLSGFASDEAGYLQTIKNGTINIHGLILSGLIIGLLGVLQDITISQAAVVFQLKDARKDLNFFELFKRAMDVGRDHIASMSNTLVLVYAGASLPLLLLFLTNPLPFSAVVNFEIVAEEIVRTLISSIGLILAVPITTALTALIVEFKTKEVKSSQD